jgi:hypothetical protein
VVSQELAIAKAETEALRDQEEGKLKMMADGHRRVCEIRDKELAKAREETKKYK